MMRRVAPRNSGKESELEPARAIAKIRLNSRAGQCHRMGDYGTKCTESVAQGNGSEPTALINGTERDHLKGPDAGICEASKVQWLPFTRS